MLNSFRNAFNGVRDALKSEPNLRFHFLVSIVVIFTAYILNFNYLEFAILFLTIFFVIVLELINTIVEKLVDMYSTAISEKAREIKDISAAVVLIGAFASAIIGLFLFGSKMW